VKLFVDDTREPPAGWVTARTIPAAQAALLANPDVTHVSLDHDFRGSDQTGQDLVKWMAQRHIWPSENIRVHSGNVQGAQAMKRLIGQTAPAHLRKAPASPYTAARRRLQASRRKLNRW
jgi:hypothetical protein